ncbi:hypothetical protein [Rhizobium sp. CCGE 510]|uniref:hypothetical protein n=1 Tax=Rhizobium sp. CCGE 510 TaxID=1132836 RepID=UPI0012F7063C|nr:hypothetical protein [Rhizobium sp. CCGE 510]
MSEHYSDPTCFTASAGRNSHAASREPIIDSGVRNKDDSLVAPAQANGAVLKGEFKLRSSSNPHFSVLISEVIEAG